MNFKYIIGLCISLLILYSCNDSSDTTYDSDLSKDAQLYTFSMQGVHNKGGDSLARAQDSLRFLVFNKTNFTINQVGSYIYNQDSLPYGMEFKHKVMLTVTTNPTYGAQKIEIETPDSTYTWNSSDSVYISKMPVRFIVHAWSGNSKTYDLKLLIHQVDPDIFIWNNMGNLPQSAGAQKVLLKDDEFYVYTIVSGNLKLFKANKNTLYWTEESLSVLPSTVMLNSITYIDGLFVAVSETGDAFTSADGISWSLATYDGARISAVYGVIPGKNESEDQLLLLMNKNGGYALGTTRNMSDIEYPNVTGLGGEDLIPLEGFASATNYDRSSASKYLVLTGGFSVKNQELNSTLLFENNAGSISVMRSVKNSFFQGRGLSLFFYTDNYLYVIAQNQLYRSNSWGEKWEEAPEKQILDEGISSRTEQSVVANNGYIWLFGGKDSDTEIYLNDIWKGRLNSFK